MIKIAIVENELSKLQAIKEVLLTCQGISEDDIAVFTTIRAARSDLVIHRYDLLLLDLHLPEREGGPSRHSAGLALLKQVYTSARYQRPAQVLFITEYQTEKENLSKEICGRIWACLNYKIGDQAWREDLLHIIEHLASVEIQEKLFSFDYDCLIIAALDKPELEALQGIQVEWIKIQSGRHWAWHAFIETPKGKMKFAIVSAPQMGCTSAAVRTFEIVTWLKPRCVLMCGITAGIKQYTNLGDILIADPCWEWGTGKHSEKNGKLTFECAPTQIRATTEIIETLRNRAFSKQLIREVDAQWEGKRPSVPPQVRIGPAVSGASVVASKRVSDAISKQHRKLLGIDMEAYGVYYAVHSINRGIHYASLKSVCDFADAKKTDDYQEYAAFLSARFAFDFAKHFLSK